MMPPPPHLMGNRSFVLCACSVCFARSRVGCGVRTPVALYVFGDGRGWRWEVEGWRREVEGMEMGGGGMEMGGGGMEMGGGGMEMGGGGDGDGRWRDGDGRWRDGDGRWRGWRWEVEGM